jgi:hypothetical protein
MADEEPKAKILSQAFRSLILLNVLAYSFLYNMDKSEIQDYLYYEFHVLSPSELDNQSKIIAYERLRHKIITEDKPALDIAENLITLNEVLDYD